MLIPFLQDRKIGPLSQHLVLYTMRSLASIVLSLLRIGFSRPRVTPFKPRIRKTIYIVKQRTAIDQYSSLLYVFALGFFHPQCGRSTFQLRLRELRLRGNFSPFLYKGFTFSLGLAKKSNTHLYTTFNLSFRLSLKLHSIN
ncbi:hypothetical protein VTH06DRAFT_7524 [Thermothelomyces fergusii]